MAMGTFHRASIDEWFENVPLKDYFVFWDEINIIHLKAIYLHLMNAKTEHDWQNLFESCPILLLQHLNGGHGRWVIPHKALGAEYKTDFIIGEENSDGYHWQAIELESHKSKCFTKKGNYTKELTHAIKQILDWRSWLSDNITYARNDKNKNGLGLIDIVSNLPGLIIIGRRKDFSDKDKFKRRDIGMQLNLKIHTYDWLFEKARERFLVLNNDGQELINKFLK